MSTPWLMSIVLFALAGAISPGPVNLLATAVGSQAGFVRALPHVSGASLSYVLIVWLSGVGLQQLWHTWPALGAMLPYAGAGYVLYLSGKIALASPSSPQDASAPCLPGFWQGVCCQTLNPKAWWVAMSGVSVLVGSGPDSAGRLAVFCAISGVICWGSVACWAALGQLIRPWLAQAGHQRWFNRGMALALLGSMVPMLLPASQ
ncbi:hypothetical protein BXU06_15155 [Aquaspirillum sp. LM1]|uniref:LysE family translocator n=1 Tax=Aquaspirillum sp. LM1 TaxID=1938604 RepID=UPI000983B14E|nr:LysE family translocator [Aquaspirillum sp. LM1]AQR66234.1 hypothetical protein BXU06_15155 [Aquaspirillum sp. LM1]